MPSHAGLGDYHSSLAVGYAIASPTVNKISSLRDFVNDKPTIRGKLKIKCKRTIRKYLL